MVEERRSPGRLFFVPGAPGNPKSGQPVALPRSATPLICDPSSLTQEIRQALYERGPGQHLIRAGRASGSQGFRVIVPAERDDAQARFARLRPGHRIYPIGGRGQIHEGETHARLPHGLLELRCAADDPHPDTVGFSAAANTGREHEIRTKRHNGGDVILQLVFTQDFAPIIVGRITIDRRPGNG